MKSLAIIKERERERKKESVSLSCAFSHLSTWQTINKCRQPKHLAKNIHVLLLFWAMILLGNFERRSHCLSCLSVTGVTRCSKRISAAAIQRRQLYGKVWQLPCLGSPSGSREKIPYLSWTDATALLCAALREYAYYIPKRKEKNEIKKGEIAAR